MKTINIFLSFNFNNYYIYDIIFLDGVCDMCLSNDEKLLIIGGANKIIKIYDNNSYNEINTLI